MNPIYQLENYDGANLAIYDNGNNSKPVIFFIHGNSLSGSIFHKQFTDPALSGYRLISFDLPGHGLSRKSNVPEKVYTLEGMTRTVSHVIKSLQIQGGIAAGFSLGAPLLMQNKDTANLFDGVVLFGYPPVSSIADLMVAGTPTPALPLLMQPTLSSEETDIILNEMKVTREREQFAALMAMTDAKLRPTLFGSLGSSVIHDELPVIHSFKNKVAYIHFEHDVFVREAYVQEKKIPNLWRGGPQQIKSAGHCGFHQESAMFNTLLLAYTGEILP